MRAEDRRTEYPRTDWDNTVEEGMRAAMFGILMFFIAAIAIWLAFNYDPHNPEQICGNVYHGASVNDFTYECWTPTPQEDDK